jgi:hypothetical protein
MPDGLAASERGGVLARPGRSSVSIHRNVSEGRITSPGPRRPPALSAAGHGGRSRPMSPRGGRPSRPWDRRWPPPVDYPPIRRWPAPDPILVVTEGEPLRRRQARTGAGRSPLGMAQAGPRWHLQLAISRTSRWPIDNPNSPAVGPSPPGSGPLILRPPTAPPFRLRSILDASTCSTARQGGPLHRADLPRHTSTVRHVGGEHPCPQTSRHRLSQVRSPHVTETKTILPALHCGELSGSDLRPRQVILPAGFSGIG